MVLFKTRPDPKFRPGLLVLAKPNDIFREERYLVIARRRWASPKPQAPKEWLYYGTVLAVNRRGLLRFKKYDDCFPESQLSSLYTTDD